jgi:hypothetical protein
MSDWSKHEFLMTSWSTVMRTCKKKNYQKRKSLRTSKAYLSNLQKALAGIFKIHLQIPS